jgi:hypothetical protein
VLLSLGENSLRRFDNETGEITFPMFLSGNTSSSLPPYKKYSTRIELTIQKLNPLINVQLCEDNQQLEEVVISGTTTGQ